MSHVTRVSSHMSHSHISHVTLKHDAPALCLHRGSQLHPLLLHISLALHRTHDHSHTSMLSVLHGAHMNLHLLFQELQPQLARDAFLGIFTLQQTWYGGTACQT